MSEHPLISRLKIIRDNWRLLAEAQIGTSLEGENFQRLCVFRLNEMNDWIYKFSEEAKKAGEL